MIDVEKAMHELREEIGCARRVQESDRSGDQAKSGFYMGYQDGLSYALTLLRDMARGKEPQDARTRR